MTLQKQNEELMKKNEEMSSEKKRKLSESDVKSKEVISVEDDIEDSPVKRQYMAHNREESSYLPEYIAPAQNQTKKIIKKVRFHDDDPVEVQPGPVQPVKVGTKRKFTRRSEVEVSDESSDEEMEDESFEKSEEKVPVRPEPKRQKVDEKPITEATKKNREIVTRSGSRLTRRRQVDSDESESEDSEEKQPVKSQKKVSKPASKSQSKSSHPDYSSTQSSVSPNKLLGQKMEAYFQKLDPKVKQNTALMQMMKKIAKR